jgi:TRAP-type mannitol/chloroaromatic compound transport system permease small subunit
MTDSPDLTDEMIAGRRSSTGKMPDDMPVWMARTIVGIDRLNLWVGRLVAVMVLPIMFSMVYEVTVRYAFNAPTIWAYDISRMFYGAMFVLGAAYGLSKGVHIRSDFIYRTWKVENQGRVDAALYVIFFFPTMILLLWVSFDWAWTSLIRGERGMDTAFAPLLGPVRSALPIGVFLLILQGVSELLKSIYAAKTGRWPDA